MPMAGKGKRFKKEKFLIHKPFIKINDNYMFLEASKCMPNANKWIFIYKPISKKKYNIEKQLPINLKKKTKVLYLKKNTLGQADTCLRAEKYINSNSSVFIHSCDNFISFDKQKYLKLIKKYDAIIFTTKPNKYHLNNIQSFGWVSGKRNKIINIECKKEASKKVINDYVIVGTFAFKNKKILFNSIRNIISNKVKINQEYYLDSVLKNIFSRGFKVFNYVVDKHVSWGTPKELSISKK